MLPLLILAALDTRAPSLSPKRLEHADALFRAALAARPLAEPECAMPEALSALDGQVAQRDFLSTLAIQGPTHTHDTPHFRLIYAADPESRHAVPAADVAETLTLPDGTTRELAQNGVPNYVERAGHLFEYARVWYLAHGFRVPNGTVEVRFVFIVDAFGGISLEPFGIGISARMTNSRLAHVVAHELFHQVQYEHAEPTWLTYFGKLDNSSLYDTFALEAVANAGSSLIFDDGTGTPIDANAARYTADPDVDFWNQKYDGSTFWRFMMEQLSSTDGNDVLISFLNERGGADTQEALRKVLSRFHGPALSSFVAQYRVAIAVKGHFDTPKPYDFLGDGASRWPSVASTTLNAQTQSEIDEDGGAEYFTLPSARSGTHVLRLVGASTDLRAQLAQVWQRDGQRGVSITQIAGRDGKNDVPFTVVDGLLRSYLVVESLDGAQPFIVALDPVASEVPDLKMTCSAGSGSSAWLVLAALLLVRVRRRASITAS